jgi:uncharacterized membrane protein YhaH (DUF805 family)
MPSTSVPPPADVVDALPRQRIADPDFWLAVLAWLTIAFGCQQILLFSFGRDQSIYAVIGDGILHGRMPYRDLWDFKPPGIYLVYALAEQLFGRNMLAPRLLEVAGLLGLVMAFRSLSQTFFGIRRPGLLGAALAVLIHAQLEFWHTGQPEAFGGFLTAYALVVTVRDNPRKRAWIAWAGMGLLFGFAFLLKPPLGGGAVVCAAYLARREYARGERWRDAVRPVLVAGAASLVPIALCALWFRARGAWPALDWTFFHFTPGYTRLGWTGQTAPEMFYDALEEAFFHFSALAAFGVIAAIVIRPMHTREREGVFLLLGVISVQLAGVAMQGKFFQYHYSATLPLIAFIGGLGLYKLWRRCLPGGPGGALAFASFVVVAVSMRTAVNDVPGGFWWRSAQRMEYLVGATPYRSRLMLDRELYRVADFNLDADRRVAAEIQLRTAPGARVFVWGFDPAIYWFSRRAPASRFIYDVPQRVTWQRGLARSWLMHDLEAHAPAMIVVQRNDVFPYVTGHDFDSARALVTFPELDTFLIDRYHRVARVAQFVLYEANDAS